LVLSSKGGSSRIETFGEEVASMGGERKPVWARKDLVGLRDLEPWEIELLLDRAQELRSLLQKEEFSHRPGAEAKELPLPLRGRMVVLFFVEPSTRTRVSFEIAARKLGASPIFLEGEASSLKKGETLLDTVRNLEALGADILIVRHPVAGVPAFLGRRSRICLVNAGDGAHEHPTQALADLLTVRQRFGRIQGLKISIVGDILHSRVARSDLWGFLKMGAEVTLVGPRTLLPEAFARLPVRVAHRLEEGLTGAKVILLLRLQEERYRHPPFPSLAEYVRLYQVTPRVLEAADPQAILMHPGPVHPDVEVAQELLDSTRSVILEQAAYGVAARMAALELLGKVGDAR
jgi:aspartate carbamoyltransferase catalytic subunit